MSLPIPPRADLDPDASTDRPLATWTVFHSIGIFLLGNVLLGQLLISGLLVFLVYGGVLPRTDGVDTEGVVLTVATDLAMAGVILAWLRLRREPIPELLGVPPRGRWARDIAIGVASGAALYVVVSFGVANVLSWIIEHLSHGPIVTPHQLSPDLSTGGKVLAALLAIVVAPPAEELFFRGILFKGLRDRQGLWVAAGVSSALFGLAHLIPGPWRGVLVLVLSLTVTGLGLALLYDRRKNLVTNIAAHATFNVIGVILLFWFPKFAT